MYSMIVGKTSNLLMNTFISVSQERSLVDLRETCSITYEYIDNNTPHAYLVNY